MSKKYKVEGRDRDETKSKATANGTKEWKEETRTGICTPTFIAAFVTIVRRWEQPRCPSAERWIHKMGYTHPRDIVQPEKGRKILTHITTWMNLRLLG